MHVEHAQKHHSLPGCYCLANVTKALQTLRAFATVARTARVVVPRKAPSSSVSTPAMVDPWEADLIFQFAGMLARLKHHLCAAEHGLRRDRFALVHAAGLAAPPSASASMNI